MTEALEMLVREFLLARMPEGTARAYGSATRGYESFCRERQVAPWPAVPVVLALYMLWMYANGKARGTIELARSAVGSAERFADEEAVSTVALVRETMAFVRRNTPAPQRKLPITRECLDAVGRAIVDGAYLSGRDYFMFLLSQKAMLRASECVALRMGDVWVEQVPVRGMLHAVLFVFVEKRKNDQERHGHTIVLGVDEDVMHCPVRWFKMYATLREKESALRGAESPYLFARDKFRQASKPLKPESVNGALKRACEKAGIETQRFTFHCLRVGGVSAAIARGVELRLIARHGGWKSDAIYNYVFDDIEAQLSVSQAI